ncbi:hypothetical protein EVAR_86203_1 [Eumeta japonica]|uniref:Uncharacterized protein n=1 Tax=Eumeta variegata TaxID=151549 RepID=A0A4C1UBU4_EUMVA|nr:hypothetical protein EVAR_86203_1 [Eumeta japonica]
MKYIDNGYLRYTCSPDDPWLAAQADRGDARTPDDEDNRQDKRTLILDIHLGVPIKTMKNAYYLSLAAPPVCRRGESKYSIGWRRTTVAATAAPKRADTGGQIGRAASVVRLERAESVVIVAPRGRSYNARALETGGRPGATASPRRTQGAEALLDLSIGRVGRGLGRQISEKLLLYKDAWGGGNKVAYTHKKYKSATDAFVNFKRKSISILDTGGGRSALRAVVPEIVEWRPTTTRPNASTRSQRYYRKPSNDWQIRNIKTELVKRLSDSKERKLKQLLMHEDLGDRKPSQFLRHLQGLAGPDISNDLLITIWTSRLPQNIQTVIAGQTAPTLELLADLADRVHEIAPPSLQVACTSTVSAHASH